MLWQKKKSQMRYRMKSQQLTWRLSPSQTKQTNQKLEQKKRQTTRGRENRIKMKTLMSAIRKNLLRVLKVLRMVKRAV